MKIKRKFRSTPNRLGPKRKLPGDDQFPLMWKKLRLNTPMRDLATRIGISETTCSKIFSSYARRASKIKGQKPRKLLAIKLIFCT